MSWISLFLAPLVFFGAVIWIYRYGNRQAYDEAACMALEEPERARCLRKAKRGDGPHPDRLSA